MTILAMRVVTLESFAKDRFNQFVDDLRSRYPSLLKPLRQLQADLLGVDGDKITWGTSPEEALLPLNDADTLSDAEVLRVPGGLLVLHLLGTDSYDEEEAPATEYRLTASAITSDSATSLLDDVSAVGAQIFEADFTPHHFRNPRFAALRQEIDAEDIPSSLDHVAAAAALEKRGARALAIAIKSSRGVLASDLRRQSTSDSPLIDQDVDALVEASVIQREFVVVCTQSRNQIVRVADPTMVSDIARSGVRCACGAPIESEPAEELLTVTELGSFLIDKSRWMSVLTQECLIRLGVPQEDILLECQSGSDEIDCIALVSGEIMMFELKDKAFSIGNAYSFGAKLSTIRPEHSVIVTTDIVGPEVKQHFSRSRAGDRTRRYTRDVAEPIYYLEGEFFVTAIERLVRSIYRKDSRGLLDSAMSMALAEGASIVDHIAQPDL